MSIENIKQGSVITDKVSLLLRNGENEKALDLLGQNYGPLARNAMEKVMKYSNLSQDEMVRVFGKISDILENVADKISRHERLNEKKEKAAAAREQAEDAAELAAIQAEAMERRKKFEDRMRWVEEQKQKLAEERRQLEEQRRFEKDVRKRREIEEKLKRLEERKNTWKRNAGIWKKYGRKIKTALWLGQMDVLTGTMRAFRLLSGIQTVHMRLILPPIRRSVPRTIFPLPQLPVQLLIRRKMRIPRMFQTLRIPETRRLKRRFC